MNTLLLIGGELCIRTALRLDPSQWTCIGLRRNPAHFEHADRIDWHQADLSDAASLAFLDAPAFAGISHILYAPTPGGRTAAHYEAVYPAGLRALFAHLPPTCRAALQRCVLVGSTAVWAPSEEWIDEGSPVQISDFRSHTLLAAEAEMQAALAPGVGVALRLSGLYGPGRTRLLERLRAGEVIAPDGPCHWSNRIHIDDAASACAHLLSLHPADSVYIGTDDSPMETAAVYEALAKQVGGPIPSRQPQPPSGKRLSNARLRASGWAPAWPSILAWHAHSDSAT